MRFCVLTIFLVFIVSPVSAHFFPNISAIPPSLIRNTTRTLWDAFHNLTGCHAGDTVNGLAKLKLYFQRFGYIPENFSGNFTDDFDEMLESAITSYQRNFRLNVTGQLDDLTLRHIVMPRCGNPDVVNGTSTMHGSRKYEIGDGHGHGIHTVGHYTFFPGTPRWPAHRRDLSYAFRAENQLTEDVKRVFARAFERWAAVTKLTFTRVDSLLAADITIGFYSGDHGDGEPFDGVLGTLAHAFSPPSGRFHLDEAENWVVAGDLDNMLPASAAVDLESVAVHEIGHLLGLGHSSVEDAIMYPTISTGKRKVELNGDDVEGIQVLYGANPNYNGSTSTPSTHQRDTGDFGRADRVYGATPGLVFSMGLGFVIWALF